MTCVACAGGLASGWGRSRDLRYCSPIIAMLCAPTKSRWIHRWHSMQAHTRMDGLARRVFSPLEAHVGHTVDERYSSTKAALYPKAKHYQR